MCAEPKRADEYDSLALHQLIKSKSSGVDVVACIADTENLNALDQDGNAPLHLVAKVKGVWTSEEIQQIITQLIQRGASTTIKNSLGDTATQIAFEHYHVEVLEALLRHGIEPDISGKDQLRGGNRSVTHSDRTATLRRLLIDAANQGCLSLCRWCLAVGVDPNAGIVDGQGKTPLFLASRHGHIDVVAFLIERGADPNIRDYFFRSPLNRAAKYGHTEVVSYLLENKANIKNGWSNEDLLRSDSDLKSRHTADFCSTFDADALWKGTPLHIAAGFGHLEIARLLIEAGIPIDILDKNGETPLRWAANNRLQTAKRSLRAVAVFLIMKGANVALRDIHGTTVREVLVGNNVVHELLLTSLLSYNERLLYANPLGDDESFFQFVRQCGERLGITVSVTKLRFFLLEYFGFFKRIWQWDHLPSDSRHNLGNEPTLQKLEWWDMIFGALTFNFFRGGAYLRYERSKRRLNIRVRSYTSPTASYDPVISGFLYAYAFLIAEDLHRKGLTRLSGHEYIASRSGVMAEQPDGDIMINAFPDRFAPTSERLCEIEDLVLRHLQIKRQVFEDMRI